MKLNLVPTHVSKERQGKSAIFIMVAIMVIGIVISVLLITSSKTAMDQAHAENDDAKPKADAAVNESNYADTLIKQATLTIQNANLAQAMLAHNDVYPDFYTKDIIPYIPPYFRIQSLSATPDDAQTCTVTMVGTITTFQQYADLALGLMRIPGAITVARGGFTGEQYMVPGLTPEDQVGRYRKTTDPTIPDDPQDRLQYLEQQGSAPSGYLNVGGFGSGTSETRGAMPNESLITIQVTVAKDLQTPDPSATVRTETAVGGATALTGGGAAAPGMSPGGGPMGGNLGGPPPSPGAPGGGGAGAGAGGGKNADN